MPEDYFALLDEPRRPWIDPEELKQKFLALSGQVHPDRVHNAPEQDRQAAERKFSELNSAYNCLLDPKDRLRHLLELELGAKPPDVQRIPPGLMDAFFEVGRLCKETDAFLSEKRAVASPLLQVQFFERAQDYSENINNLLHGLNERREELFNELRDMNRFWQTDTDAAESKITRPLERLEEIHRLLGFFGRWAEQLQERIVQLSF